MDTGWISSVCGVVCFIIFSSAALLFRWSAREFSRKLYSQCEIKSTKNYDLNSSPFLFIPSVMTVISFRLCFEVTVKKLKIPFCSLWNLTAKWISFIRIHFLALVSERGWEGKSGSMRRGLPFTPPLYPGLPHSYSPLLFCFLRFLLFLLEPLSLSAAVFRHAEGNSRFPPREIYICRHEHARTKAPRAYFAHT